MGDFYLGLDLGQAQDYTALAIVEQHSGDREPVFEVRHLERFALRTTYPTIAAHVADMTRSERLNGRVLVIVDATGVGRPVVDLLRGADIDLVPVTITGGDAVACEYGEYRVPKRDLVGVMQVLLQNKRLRIAAALPDAATLQKELLNFQVKIDTRTAHDSYGAWREGTHDDLVLAVALACWYADRYGGASVCSGVDNGASRAQDFPPHQNDEDDDLDSLYQ